MINHKTREGWLASAMGKLDATFFQENGYDLPEKLQVSCGFPRGTSKAIGQCWDPQTSADGTTQMFVCPSLGSDLVVVLQVLLHEMIHAGVGLDCGHRGAFRKLAKQFGMAGKMKATYAEEGGELHKALTLVGESLGAYPHAPMQKRHKAAGRPGGGHTIRLRSPAVGVDYEVRLRPRFLEEHGAPLDPWGNEMEPVD